MELPLTSLRGGGTDCSHSHSSSSRYSYFPNNSSDRCPPTYAETAAAAAHRKKCSSRRQHYMSRCYDSDALRIPPYSELRRSRAALERTGSLPEADVSPRKRYSLKQCSVASIDKDISTGSGDKSHGTETLHEASAAARIGDKSYCCKTPSAAQQQAKHQRRRTASFPDDASAIPAAAPVRSVRREISAGSSKRGSASWPAGVSLFIFTST